MAIEENTRDDVNRFLARGARLLKEIDYTAAAEQDSIAKFKRISKRKKLLTLIALTDRENQNFVSAVEPFMSGNVGAHAWYSLNYVLLKSERSNELITRTSMPQKLRETILLAAERGRLIDDDALILNADESRDACIRILQFGSIKQRISMTMNGLSEKALTQLLMTADDELLKRAMNWAKDVA